MTDEVKKPTTKTPAGEIAEIRERNVERRKIKAATTAGPWKHDLYGTQHWVEAPDDMPVLDAGIGSENPWGDCAFAAYAHEDCAADDIDFLLAEVQRLGEGQT